MGNNVTHLRRLGLVGVATGLLAWHGTQMFRIGVSDDSSETEEEPHLSLNL